MAIVRDKTEKIVGIFTFTSLIEHGTYFLFGFLGVCSCCKTVIQFCPALYPTKKW